MKTISRLPNLSYRQLGMALLVGMLFGLAFPKPGFSWIAWLAPGWLLWLAGANGGRHAGRIGFYAGLGFHLTALHWFLFIPIPLNAILGWLALSSYLALFMGGWCWVTWRIVAGVTGNRSENVSDYLANLSMVRRLLCFTLSATAWVSMEMVMARVLTGFPWNLLGVSQYKLVPLLQIGSFTGVYGISFVVAWVSVTLVFTGMLLRKGRLKPRAAFRELAVPVSVLLLLLGYGFAKMNRTSAPERFINIALIQPSFPQPLIWDANEKTNRFNALLDLSRRALESKPDVMVWPETSLPDFFTRHNEVAIREIRAMAQTHNVWMVFGANDTRVRETNGVREVDLFNSAFLVNPAGELANRYHKRHLVMFGEYMPLRDWFPFLKQLRGSGGGLTAGIRDVPFELGAQRAKSAVLICFEDAFPHLARHSVSTNTDFLLNLTNDGWFGRGSIQWQHAAAAAFRAIENGVPLVRCANNGLTCWVDAQGRWHEVYFEGSRDVHSPGFKLARVPLKTEAQRQLTFYTRHGDVFGWSCVTFTAILFCAFGFRNAPRSKIE